MERETKRAPRPLDGPQIGQRIALARENAGITQAELAEAIGVIPRSVQNYEYGRIPFRALGKIAQTIGVTRDWILYGDDGDDSTAAVVQTDFDARFNALEAKLDQIITLLKRRR